MSNLSTHARQLLAVAPDAIPPLSALPRSSPLRKAFTAYLRRMGHRGTPLEEVESLDAAVSQAVLETAHTCRVALAHTEKDSGFPRRYPQYNIRSATTLDLPDITQTEQDTNEHPLDVHKFGALMTGRERGISDVVARVGRKGSPIAHALCENRQHYVNLCSLGVKASERGKGAAEALLGHMLETLGPKGRISLKDGREEYHDPIDSYPKLMNILGRIVRQRDRAEDEIAFHRLQNNLQIPQAENFCARHIRSMLEPILMSDAEFCFSAEGQRCASAVHDTLCTIDRCIDDWEDLDDLEFPGQEKIRLSVVNGKERGHYRFFVPRLDERLGYSFKEEKHMIKATREGNTIGVASYDVVEEGRGGTFVLHRFFDASDNMVAGVKAELVAELLIRLKNSPCDRILLPEAFSSAAPKKPR